MTVSPEFSKFRWNDNPVRVALKDTAGALANVMFNKANMDGTKVYGSQENLAVMLGVTPRTVRRAQKELETLGLIRCTSKGSGRSGKSSEFVLTMPELNTGHGCTEYQTSVTGIPDTGVPP